MKQGSGGSFPFALIITLAALTAWLKHAVELPEERDGKHRHDPDYIIANARVTRLDDAGAISQTSRSERIVHYPDDDSTEITRPHLVYLNPGRTPVTMQAERAEVSSGGDQVVLREQVEVRRAESAKQPALLARMDHLTVFPDDERAITDALVEITQGRSRLRGTGMEIDNEKQLFVLKSKVTGQFEPQRQKKQGRS